MEWPTEAMNSYFSGKEVSFIALDKMAECDFGAKTATITSVKKTKPEGIVFSTTGDAEEIIVCNRCGEFLTYYRINDNDSGFMAEEMKMSEDGKNIVQAVIEVIRKAIRKTN